MKVVRRVLILFLVLVMGVGLLWPAPNVDCIADRSSSDDGRGSVTLLSRTHTIDKLYQSMQGPYSNHPAISLARDARPQLLWLTGIRSELVGPDGRSEVSREFFCHGNLTFTPDRVSARRSDGTFTEMPDQRLFTLVPGRLSVSLPAGFGVPVYSDEPLDCFSMSLNLNLKDRVQQLRFKTVVNYVRDGAPAARDMKPLFRRVVYGFEPIGRISPHAVCASTLHPGAACGAFVGRSASNAFVDSIGKTNTIHWLIPPGAYESHVPVTEQLGLAYDTTAHYVTAHLHPFGKSIKLVDLTEKKTVFTIGSQDFGDRLGVARMDELVLPQGVELHTDHKYELVTTYHNPTDQPIDAMSILYIYALDEQFRPAGGGAPQDTVAIRR